MSHIRLSSDTEGKKKSLPFLYVRDFFRFRSSISRFRSSINTQVRITCRAWSSGCILLNNVITIIFFSGKVINNIVTYLIVFGQWNKIWAENTRYTSNSLTFKKVKKERKYQIIKKIYKKVVCTSNEQITTAARINASEYCVT